MTWWEVSEADYHASDLVSRSKLDVLRRSPEEFHARFVARTIVDGPPTKALRVGRMTHVAVLEPHTWEQRFCLPPPDDLGPPEPVKPVPAEGTTAQSKAHRDALAEWRPRHEQWARDVEAARVAYVGGREIVKPDEHATALACAEAIAGHDFASSLLAGRGDVYTEQAIRWLDLESGLECRARLDAHNLDDEIADLKTIDGTPDEDTVRREIVSHWYHGQAALYSDGYEATTGRRPRFWFVFVNKNPPHEVAVYELGAAEIDLGRVQYRAALRDLAERRRTGDWRAPWTQSPHLLEFAKWTFDAAKEWKL